MRSTALLSALVLASLTVAACGTDGGDDPAPTTLAPDTESQAAPADETQTDDSTDTNTDTNTDTDTETQTDDSTNTETDTAAGTGADATDGPNDDEQKPSDGVQRYPNVIDASAERVGDTWTVSATLSSPYDTPERYADAWRVVGPDGTVYGERILAHDHAAEQPFTRSQSGIEIPSGVTEVVIEGRDLEYGYGGSTFRLSLPDEA